MTNLQTLQCSVEHIREQIDIVMREGKSHAPIGRAILWACCEDVDRLRAITDTANSLGYNSVEDALAALKELEGK